MAKEPSPSNDYSLRFDDDPVVLLLVLLLRERDNWAEIELRRAESYAKGVVRARYRSALPERLGTLTETEFKCIFRMSATAMEILRNQLFPFLQVRLGDKVIVGRSRGNRRPISVDEKVCIGLLVMGGGTIGPMIWGNNIGKTSVYNVFEQFVTAVISSNVGEIHFPETLQEMEEVSQGFLHSRIMLPIFHGCLGAKDGYALRIKMPSRKTVENAVAYLNRKGYCSVNIQAVSNHEAKCIFLSTETPGGTHDATAWGCSSLGREIEKNYWVNPKTHRVYWIAADDAYGASANCLCPWPGTGLITREPFKDAFNYYFSGGIRNTVERLFGQVYARWGILWRPMRFSIRKIPLIVRAVFQLHNFLKELGDGSVGTRALGSIRTGERPYSSTHVSGFDASPHQQTEVMDELITAEASRVRTSAQCPTRTEITDYCRTNYITRPADGQL